MKFRKTNLGFYIFVNNREIYGAMVNQTWDNVIYLGDFKEENFQEFLDTGLGGLFLFYRCNNTCEYEEIYKKLKSEYSANVTRRGFGNFLEDDEANDLNKCIEFVKDYNTFNFLKSVASDAGIAIYTDYEGLCGNCHQPLGLHDKYCKFCGTKRGEGDFRPFANPSYCVYGPLIAYKFICNKCGNIWTGEQLGGSGYQHCPECGAYVGHPQVEAYMFDYWDRHKNEIDKNMSHEKIVEMALKEAEENYNTDTM